MLITSINEFFHKHGALAGIIILLLIVIPLVFGGLSDLQNTPNQAKPQEVGTIFGDDIERADFFANEAANRWAGFLGGNNFPSTIDRMIWLEAAKDQGFGDISKEEVQAKVASISFFQNQDGQFDLNRFNMMAVQSFRMPPQMLVDSIRDNMIIAGLVEKVQAEKIKNMTPEEVRSAYNDENSTIAASTAQFKIADFKAAVEVTDEILKNYLDANQAIHRKEEQKSVSFVEFNATNYADKVKTDDDSALATHFETMSELFPNKVKLSEIVINVDPTAEESVKAEKKAKAEEALAKLGEGQAFADVAKAYSDAPSKENKGETGWIGNDILKDKAQIEAVDALKVGEISPIIETEDAFYIYRMDEPRQTLAMHRKAVVKGYVKDQSEDLAERAATNFANAIYSAASRDKSTTATKIFSTSATTRGFEVVKTDLFNARTAKVDGVDSNSFVREAMKLTADNSISEAIVGNNGKFYAACFESVVPAHTPELNSSEAFKKEVTDKYVTLEATKAAQAAADQAFTGINEALKAGKVLEQAAGEVKFNAIADFKSSENSPAGLLIPFAPIKEAALASAGNELLPVQRNTNEGFVLVYIKSVTKPTDEEFEAGKTTAEETVRTRLRNLAVSEYTAKLKVEAEPKITETYQGR